MSQGGSPRGTRPAHVAGPPSSLLESPAIEGSSADLPSVQPLRASPDPSTAKLNANEALGRLLQRYSRADNVTPDAEFSGDEDNLSILSSMRSLTSSVDVSRTSSPTRGRQPRRYQLTSIERTHGDNSEDEKEKEKKLIDDVNLALGEEAGPNTGAWMPSAPPVSPVQTPVRPTGVPDLESRLRPILHASMAVRLRKRPELLNNLDNEPKTFSDWLDKFKHALIRVSDHVNAPGLATTHYQVSQEDESDDIGDIVQQRAEGGARVGQETRPPASKESLRVDERPVSSSSGNISEDSKRSDQSDEPLTATPAAVPVSSFKDMCHKMAGSTAFNILMSILIVMQAVLLTWQEWPHGNRYTQTGRYGWVDWVMVAFYAAYTVEMGVNIVASGFAVRKVDPTLEKYLAKVRPKAQTARSPTQIKVPAYLYGECNQTDLLAIVSFWISFGLAMSGVEHKYNITAFRTLMCFKLVRLFNLTYGVRLCLRGMLAAVKRCWEVVVFLGFFGLLFGLVGVLAFKGSFRRHCVWHDPHDPSVTFTNDLQFCGSHRDPLDGTKLPYLYADGSSSEYAKGYTCSRESQCMTLDNPYNGTLSFDNIFHSLEVVFVVISGNSFTDLMYYTMDSDHLAACIFFILGITILTVGLLNLVVTVVITVYPEHIKLIEDKEHKGFISLFEGMVVKRYIQYNDCVDDSNTMKTWFQIEPLFVWVILADFLFQCTKNTDVPMNGFNRYYLFEAVTTIVLLCEIIVRFLLFACPKKALFFFYSPWNWIDSALAIGSAVIVIPPVYSRMGDWYGWLSVLQIARFYRVVMSFDFIKDAWYNIFSRIRPFLHLIGLLLVSIYVVGLAMTRLFSGVISDDSDSDYTLQGLPNAMLTLYTVTSTESWTNVLYLCQQYSKKWTAVCCAIALVAWLCYSSFVILNIFIAIITENIGNVPEEQKKPQQIKRLCAEMVRGNVDGDPWDWIKNKTLAPRRSRHEGAVMDKLVSVLKKFDNSSDEDLVSIIQKPKKSSFLVMWGPRIKDVLRFLPLYGKMGKIIDDKVKERVKEDSDGEESVASVTPAEDNALGLFGPGNGLRRACQSLVPPIHGEGEKSARAWKAFSALMYLATLAAIAIECYTTPLQRRNLHGRWGWTLYTDLCFSILFTAEFVIKVVADGFAFSRNTYLRSYWNVIDFVVLISYWVTFCAVIRGKHTLTAIVGAIRALRAIRLLSIWSASRRTFRYSIVSGAGQIIAATGVVLSVLLPTALWGLNIFRGKVDGCNDGESDLAGCVNEYSNTVFNWSVLSPRAYLEPNLQFNSFRNAFFTMFQMISLDGWVDLLSALMGITGRGTPPKSFATPENGIYLIMFNFFSIVLISNLFVSMILQHYSMHTGSAYLTEEQRDWYEVKQLLGQVKPSRRADRPAMGDRKRKLYDTFIAKHNPFERLSKVLLFVHIIVMLCDHYNASSRSRTIRFSLLVVTTSFLLFITLVRWFAFGTSLFFFNSWNVFRVGIFGGAFVFNIVARFTSRGSAFSVVSRVFLALTLLFIFPRVDILNRLLRSAYYSLPSIASVIYTWMVLCLVFAIALNQVFGLTRLGPGTSGNANARTVIKAMLMLFRCSFGEGWNDIMMDFAVNSRESCTTARDVYNSDCGNESFAYVVFIAWNILSMYMFMNILMSMIVENFSYISNRKGPHALITRDELRKFKESWNRFDPDGTGCMDVSKFQKFMASLDGVLSYPVHDEQLRVPNLVSNCILPNKEDPYKCRLDLASLTQEFSGVDFHHISTRRRRYTRLVVEAQLQAVKTEDGTKLLFTNVIREIALYALFKDSACLTLPDFLERTRLMEKVNEKIDDMRVLASLQMGVARLLFVNYKREKNPKMLELLCRLPRSAKGIS